MTKVLRYVVLRHDPGPGVGRPLHWDFMLEAQEVLRTWALASEPVENRPIDAEQLTDHRLEYLTYEGPLGDDRGQVSRWDQGVWLPQGEVEGELKAQLFGKKLKGRVTLSREQPGSEPIQRWRFLFVSDMRGSGSSASS